MRRAGSRLLLAALGLGATGLAILGVWLPGLPTTPLVLVALWAFSASSERLSAWLRRLPLLRRALEAADRYQRERTLPLGVKLVAQGFAWGSTLLVWLLTGSPWITLAVGLAALACSAFMLLTPTRRARPPADHPAADPAAPRAREGAR